MTTPKRTRTLGYVILYVRDVALTVSFYERALGLSLRFMHESGKYAELETGSTALAFSDELDVPLVGQFALNRSDQRPAGAEVALVVDDVQAAYDQAIAGGATPVLAPTEKPWGQTVSYVRDLNGVLVELCSAVAT
jgi:lactoylglutathione lyase